MLGAVGNDAASSAKSKCGGAGLGGGKTTGGSCRTGAGSGSDTLVAAKDMGSGEMDHFGLGWGELGPTGCVGSVGGV